jgi:hypothetical protein
VGSWEDLSHVLSDRFAYVDGSTGERWDMSRHIADLREHPSPGLTVDQVVVHVAGDTAGVSARSTAGTGSFNRYLDVYAREGGTWTCVQACVWPLPDELQLALVGQHARTAFTLGQPKAPQRRTGVGPGGRPRS